MSGERQPASALLRRQSVRFGDSGGLAGRSNQWRRGNGRGFAVVGRRDSLVLDDCTSTGLAVRLVRTGPELHQHRRFRRIDRFPTPISARYAVQQQRGGHPI